jgi:hypothetical protein
MPAKSFRRSPGLLRVSTSLSRILTALCDHIVHTAKSPRRRTG